MRSAQGNGYTLVVLDRNLGDVVLGPGAALVSDGTFIVNDDIELNTGEGVELLGPVPIVGSGKLGVAISSGASGVGAVRRDVVRHEKPWGWELEVVTEAKDIQLKLLWVEENHRTSEQYHEQKDEVMMGVDDDQEPMHVPSGTVHRVAGPLLYFEASTYHPDDVVRISDDYGR